jgi:hypothetical protein
MKTSNFSTHTKHRFPNPVSISRFSPQDYDGRIYLDLAPSAELLSFYKKTQDVRKFRDAYNLQLSKLDPAKVVADLGNDAILLCFEDRNAFCHRRLVADWFYSKLGVLVSEFIPPKAIQPSCKHIMIDNDWRLPS